MTKRNILLIIILMSVTPAFSQCLQPGFDKEEYRELMYISVRTTASEEYSRKFPEPVRFQMVYQSSPIGLDNLWDLWVDEHRTAVISIRGTTEKQESWLANFYAAMVPAKGRLQIGRNDYFEYELAKDPKAAVHVGWLISTAVLSKEILPRIRELYAQDTKCFYVMGHSQGGAIAYLMTAYLLHLQQSGVLPDDIQLKTYCSAAPKPGNLYFAYEYEAMTQNGWSFNVVNAADWVPETPFSIQTVDDFNEGNPFTHAKATIKKQKFPRNMALKYIYNRLDKPTKRAQRNYEQYLGGMTSKFVKKFIPDFVPPQYFPSNHYVRTGTMIVLTPDDAYHQKFPVDKTNIFGHHTHDVYLYLLDKME